MAKQLTFSLTFGGVQPPQLDNLELMYARGAITFAHLRAAQQISSQLDALLLCPAPFHSSAVDDKFQSWFEAACGAGVPLGPVYCAICEGLAINHIDQRYQRRKGWARAMVRKGLSLWPNTSKICLQGVTRICRTSEYS